MFYKVNLIINTFVIRYFGEFIGGSLAAAACEIPNRWFTEAAEREPQV